MKSTNRLDKGQESFFRLKFLIIFMLYSSFLFADNPMVPNVGMADPHIFIFNNKAYLFATRDGDIKAKSFVMPDWKIWSSDDLVNWTLERTISPTETYMGESNDCWATDVAFRNGKYYFYFSNGNKNTGVMVADSPNGSFKDALGKPFLPEELTPGKEYDPTVLVEDDGTAYIVFGHFRAAESNLKFYIAKLGSDMVSLAETPKVIEIIGDVKVLSGNDKPNLHKRNGIYYLSAGTHYATSTNVYGPYTRRGDSGNGEHGLDSRAHGNYFKWNGQWFHTWCHFHLGKDIARYRESYITYLHYKDNGEIVDDVDFLKAHFSTGVGQYDAGWEKIEAEWFMASSGIEKKENPNSGFEIQQVKNGGYLYFPNVRNLKKAASATFCVSSDNGGTIEVRADNENGKLLGSVDVKKTAGPTDYKNVMCELKNTMGVQNIYLKFKGKGNNLFNLDWFRFNLPVTGF